MFRLQMSHEDPSLVEWKRILKYASLTLLYNCAFVMKPDQIIWYNIMPVNYTNHESNDAKNKIANILHYSKII